MIILIILLVKLLGGGHAEKEATNEMVVTPVVLTSESPGWELKSDDENVFIYQRWVEAEPGRKAREIYAEIEVTANPYELARIIRDEQYGTKWLSMADEYKVVNHSSDQDWYAYSRFNLMPALRFDLVTHNRMEVDKTNQTITIGIIGEPGYVPETKSYRRLSHFAGKWEFTQTATDQTRVRYYLFSRTKPFLPRWMTDPFLFNEMENCVENVKQLAESL